MPPKSEPDGPSPTSTRGLALPLALALVLAGLALVSRQRASVFWTFLGTAGVLLAWTAALYASARRKHRTLVLQVLVRRQHWVQACAQGSVLLYWGWHSPVVYPFLPFVAAQLVFAYAFDSLLNWSRRDTYQLGFGPFPIIFSINLFLWFKLDWFYWQFAMVATGFLAKELIKWTRDGKRVHIFNPSSFPLGLFSLVLILTGTSNATFGTLIANTQADVPYLYLVIFLIALPGQLLFGVARMTLVAVVSLYAISMVYLAATGTYLFYDSNVPVQVFLGMHLLFTDPSTSPRSELGRTIFGVLYAALVAVFYVMLQWLGLPTFYDKLLPVPILNLLVRRIDALAAWKPLAVVNPARIARTWSPARRNLLFTSLWAIVFVALSATQGVGDKHPGQYLPFWTKACQTGNDRACTYASALTLIYCNDGSGWACNEAGIAQSASSATAAFRRACDNGFAAGCENLNRATAATQDWARGDPRVEDLPIILRGTKPRLQERDPARLYALACEQGWPRTCDRS